MFDRLIVCSCKCGSCKADFGDLERLEAMLVEDLDLAPEIEELLQDPLFGDCSDFERFMCNSEAAQPDGNPNGVPLGDSEEQQSNSSSAACTVLVQESKNMQSDAAAPIDTAACAFRSRYFGYLKIQIPQK